MTPSRSASTRTSGLIVIGALLAVLSAALLLDPVRRHGDTELELWGITLPTVCWFRRTTGLPCAGCGLTRSVVLLVHGKLAEAAAEHPFGPVVAALALAQIPPRAASLAGRSRRWVQRWDWAWNRAALGCLLLLFGWWAFRVGPAAYALLSAARGGTG